MLRRHFARLLSQEKYGLAFPSKRRACSSFAPILAFYRRKEQGLSEQMVTVVYIFVSGTAVSLQAHMVCSRR
jgi:hypothetical protein